MEFKNDPIADIVSKHMTELRSKVDFDLSGANYNRIFELVYDAEQQIKDLEELVIIKAATNKTLGIEVLRQSEQIKELKEFAFKYIETDAIRNMEDDLFYLENIALKI